jgi:hypothetical protein
MRITGHKNVQSILNYSTLSEKKHQEMSNILANTGNKKSRLESNTCVSVSPTTHNEVDSLQVNLPVSVQSVSNNPTHQSEQIQTQNN